MSINFDLRYSIVTVCRNSARTIGRTIDSVFRQTLPPAEYIFVDGGSSDRTLEIIRDKIAENRRCGGKIQFRILDQGAARGITSAWNMGLRVTNGEVIFILNSDDWYEPHCAEAVMRTIGEHPEADIVQAGVRNFPRGSDKPCGADWVRPIWLMPVLMPFVHPACFVRKRVYDRLGLFDETWHHLADYEFLYRCVDRNVRFQPIHEILVNFELGGHAHQHRREARWEMFRIAWEYNRLPVLPFLALLSRYMTDR